MDRDCVLDILCDENCNLKCKPTLVKGTSMYITDNVSKLKEFLKNPECSDELKKTINSVLETKKLLRTLEDR